MPSTMIATEVSPETASWLEAQARTRGLDRAVVAAAVLEDAARSGVSPFKDSSHLSTEERLHRFHEFTKKLKARPGPTADDSRESIYAD